jgi:hypothetical protein
MVGATPDAQAVRAAVYSKLKAFVDHPMSLTFIIKEDN